MSGPQRCPVKGCPGKLTIDSNGHGAVHARCACCESRQGWKLRNLPQVATVVCVICAGSFVVQARGAGRAKHCAACKPLSLQKQRNEWRARNPGFRDGAKGKPALVRSA
jgi:hypothetical protein